MLIVLAALALALLLLAVWLLLRRLLLAQGQAGLQARDDQALATQQGFTNKLEEIASAVEGRGCPNGAAAGPICEPPAARSRPAWGSGRWRLAQRWSNASMASNKPWRAGWKKAARRCWRIWPRARRIRPRHARNCRTRSPAFAPN